MLTQIVTVLFVAVFSVAAHAEDFQGILSQRIYHVASDRIVDVLGEKARDQMNLFSIPVERLQELSEKPDSGVTLQSTNLVIKANKARTSAQVPGRTDLFALVDFSSKLMRFVDPKKKANQVHPLGRIAPVATPSPGAPTLRPTGSNITIRGFKTEGYELQKKPDLVRLWLSKEDSSLMKLAKDIHGLAPDRSNSKDAIMDLSLELAFSLGMPMRVQALTSSGYTHQEFVLEKKSIPDSEVTLPNGFTEVK